MLLYTRVGSVLIGILMEFTLDRRK